MKVSGEYSKISVLPNRNNDKFPFRTTFALSSKCKRFSASENSFFAINDFKYFLYHAGFILSGTQELLQTSLCMQTGNANTYSNVFLPDILPACERVAKTILCKVMSHPCNMSKNSLNLPLHLRG